MKKRISTAAYLAGVTTLAVSLPMMASARSHGDDPLERTAVRDAAQAGVIQVETLPDATD